jgi:hypothetical protein
VDNQTPYEVLIAQKVETLPVPDRIDSIWANIEMQLDAGAPPDGGEGGTNPAPAKPLKGLPGAGNGLGLFFTAAIVISVGLVWLYTESKKDDAKVAPTPVMTPVIPEILSDSSIVPKESDDKNVPAAKPAMIDRRDTFNGNALPKRIDSLSKGILPYIKIDPPIVQDSNIIKLPVDTTKTLPPLKKPKGVKGIKDSDYKIVTENKDSTKKKN